MPRTSSKRYAKSSASSRRRRARTTAATGNMLPRNIMREASRIVTHAHRTVGAVTFNGATGWNSAGSNSLCMGFTQNQPYYSVGGAAFATFGAAYDNSASMANCYDMYRVKKIIIDIYPSVTDNNTNQSSTYSPIMVYCTPDYTDSNVIPNANAALAFNDCKVFQMLAGADEKGKTKYQLVIDRPGCDANVDSINVGVTTNSMSARSPWLYCSNATAEFGYAKFWAEGAFNPVGVVLGWTCVITAVYQYKNVR